MAAAIPYNYQKTLSSIATYLVHSPISSLN
jgi:hypothetical protein